MHTFVGRKEELTSLNRLYRQNRFHMVVVYGRRRVGKTWLLSEFARDKRTIAFTAQVQSPLDNLRSFSHAIYRGCGLPEGGPFESWRDALSFVASYAAQTEEPLVLLFDEFPYAAEGERFLPSILQIAIDHELSKTNLFLVLCGSNEGFMASEVLGSKSPLYGRRTAQIHLQPFDYYDAAKMLPGISVEDRVKSFATFGGTPYFLAQVDVSASFEENVETLMFDSAGVLYEEPMMLLRQELREPALYNSILGALARGATKPKAMAEACGVAPSSIGPYLNTLMGLGLVERIVPFGENPERSRKGLYRISDPFFRYWFRFVHPSVPAIETGGGALAAREVAFGAALDTYVGKQFESLCLQWVQRANKAGKLPFVATTFGQWWGPDPDVREEVDVDLLAGNPSRRTLLVGECKWRNTFDETEAIRRLEHRSLLVPGRWDERGYLLFTKKAVSLGTAQKAARRNDLNCVSADDMYDSALE